MHTHAYTETIYAAHVSQAIGQSRPRNLFPVPGLQKVMFTSLSTYFSTQNISVTRTNFILIAFYNKGEFITQMNKSK